MHISVNTAVVSKMEMTIDEQYALIAKAGFTAIDMAMGGGISTRNPDDECKCIFEKSIEEVKEYYKEHIAAIRKYGLFVTQGHARQPAYVAGNPEVIEYYIRIYKRTIEFCGYIGCPRLVIHGVDYKIDNTVDSPEQIEQQNRHLFESLIPELLQNNVTACMENLYVPKYKKGGNDLFMEGAASDPTATARLIDELNEQAGREVFGICLDTGHMHLVRKDARTYIPILGKRIKALHLSDNNCTCDAHLVPLAGNAEWDSICEALKSAGYCGDISFELDVHFNTIRAFDRDLVLPWLELTHKTGVVFQKRIQN